MSDDQRRKLVMMANQIARAFESQADDPAAAAAAHIRAFWARPMRERIVEHLQGGGDGLSAEAKAAVARLVPAHQPGA